MKAEALKMENRISKVDKDFDRIGLNTEQGSAQYQTRNSGMRKQSREFDLEERLIEFAVRIIRTAEFLPKSRVANHIAGQLIRSGTSPAPNYGEAQSAESRSDFIHKMKLCLKELRETRIWLRMNGQPAGCQSFC